MQYDRLNDFRFLTLPNKIMWKASKLNLEDIKHRMISNDKIESLFKFEIWLDLRSSPTGPGVDLTLVLIYLWQ